MFRIWSICNHSLQHAVRRRPDCGNYRGRLASNMAQEKEPGLDPFVYPANHWHHYPHGRWTRRFEQRRLAFRVLPRKSLLLRNRTINTNKPRRHFTPEYLRSSIPGPARILEATRSVK